jgi:hypothetical protein
MLFDEFRLPSDAKFLQQLSKFMPDNILAVGFQRSAAGIDLTAES